MQTPINGPIDLSIYLTSTSFSVQEGVTLARALVAACPRGASVAVRRSADKLGRAADAAQLALGARQREDNQISDEDGRELDHLVDITWGGLRLCLEGHASLLFAQRPRARRAAKLLTTLFGSTGTTFLNDTYSAQLTTMQSLFQRIEDDGLDKEIDAVCGPDFLVQLRELLPRYERMVHAMLNRKNASSENLSNHRNTLSRLVLGYATALCATVDEDDPTTWATVVTALTPLQSHRAAVASRRSASADEPNHGEPNSDEPNHA